MAKRTKVIKKFQLRNLVRWNGMEGGCIQGDIFYDGERIGTFSDDSNGGPMSYWFLDGETENRILREKHFREICEKWVSQNPYGKNNHMEDFFKKNAAYFKDLKSFYNDSIVAMIEELLAA